MVKLRAEVGVSMPKFTRFGGHWRRDAKVPTASLSESLYPDHNISSQSQVAAAVVDYLTLVASKNLTKAVLLWVELTGLYSLFCVDVRLRSTR